jgi:hypothetical protein
MTTILSDKVRAVRHHSSQAVKLRRLRQSRVFRNTEAVAEGARGLCLNSRRALARQPRGYLDFNQGAAGDFRHAGRGPCRIGRLKVTIPHLHESGRMPGQFKMKGEQLNNISVACARLRQYLPQQFKGPCKLGLGIGRDSAVGQ